MGGLFASAPLTNSGFVSKRISSLYSCSNIIHSGVIADIWDAGTRGKALAIFALAPFAGPCLGPIVGGYISNAGVSWRWLFWVLTLFVRNSFWSIVCFFFKANIFHLQAGACWVIIVFTLPETYAPILMVKKAKVLRAKFNDDGYYAPIEREDKISLSARLEKIIARPFKMLAQEPMLLAITVYISVSAYFIYQNFIF